MFAASHLPDEPLVIKPRWFGISVASLLLGAGLTGCSGAAAGGAGSVKPAQTAARAVENFMEAVADSNLDQMAALWGTPRGPAAKTGQPSDYERRISVMQAYLKNESSKVVSDVAETEVRHAIQVEIRREVCTWVVPFSVIKLADGTWIVNQVDLTQAGNPSRPCQPAVEGDTTTQQ